MALSRCPRPAPVNSRNPAEAPGTPDTHAVADPIRNGAWRSLAKRRISSLAIGRTITGDLHQYGLPENRPALARSETPLRCTVRHKKLHKPLDAFTSKGGPSCFPRCFPRLTSTRAGV